MENIEERRRQSNEYAKRKREENKEYSRVYTKRRWAEYLERNKVDIERKRKEREAISAIKNRNAQIGRVLKARVKDALNRRSNTPSARVLLGCSIEEFIKYIEDRFTDGMSWDNRGLHGWHIDHIRPCASFDLTDPKQQKECFHYTNLQPLWAYENRSKGSMYNGKLYR